MKKGKRLLSLFTAAAIAMSSFASFIVTANAETGTATVSMTYVDGTTANADTSYGTVAADTAAPIGYHKISGGSVALAKSGWGCNQIPYLKVDASAIDGNITAATLKAQISGSTDSKRTGGVGVGYNSSDWSNTLTFNTADKTITTVGTQQWTSTKSATVFEDKSWDITDALKNDTDKIVTLLMYATNAAGSNVKNPTVEITYIPAGATTYTVTTVCVTEDGNVIENSASTSETIAENTEYTPKYETSFNANGNKYTYVSGGETQTITKETEFKLVYSSRELAATKATLNAVCGDVELGTYTADLTEDTATNVPYNKYIVKDNVLYTIAAEAVTSKVYHAATVTGTQADQDITLTYTADARTPIFFAEGEDLNTGDVTNVSNSMIRCSNGLAYKVPETGVDFVTLGAGTYTIEMNVWGSKGDTYKVLNGETVLVENATTGALNGVTSSEFTLEEQTTLKVVGTALKDSGLDYILITGTGSTVDRYEVTATAGENGTVSVDKPTATAGEKVTITATADSGYIVDTITVKDADDKDVTVAEDNTFTMPASKVTVTVTFKVPPVMYDVTLTTPENGEVQLSKTSAGAGEKVTITATPADDYMVDTITVLGEDNTPIDVTNGVFEMPEQKVSVTVTFKLIPVHDITLNSVNADEGSVEVSKTSAKEGETVTITATAVDGYEVDTITVKNGDADVTVTDGTFTMPAGNVTITVTFKVKETVDYTKLIDFTNRTLTADSKGNSTTFDVTDAATAGATALAAADAGNVLKLGSGSSGASKNLGYKSQFAVEDGNTVVYGGEATLSFKLEPMQVRTDKEASILLSFADINGNAILPITVNTGATAGFTVNGTAATGIAYGNYYVVTYTMDFTNKTAGVKITSADGATTCLDVTGVAITAENITQLYKADSDWTYGFCAIDDIQLNATEIGVPVYYTITINTTRFAKLTTSTDAVYYADVNGKITIPLQKPGTTFDYTLSKVGYTDVTGTVEALTADFEDTKELTLADEDIIFIESEFGNANEAYVSAGGNRNDTISLGSIEIPDISEITVDFNFAGFGGQGGQQKTWYINTDAGKLVGIQITDDGVVAWTGWTGSENFNQSSDAGAFTNSVKIGDVPSGDFTVKFVLDKTNKAITVSYNDATYALSYDIEATTITGLGTGLYRYNGGLNTNEFKMTMPDTNYLAISGKSGVAKISGKTIERAYTLSQTVIVDGEEFTWTVADAEGNAVEGVTIANGVLSIADTAVAGDVIITATSAANAEKTATFKVTIGDFQTMSTFTIDGPKAFDVKQTTGSYTVVSAKDSFGDEVKDLLPAVVWTSSDENVLTIDAATGVATVVGAGSATITATFTNGTAVSTATIPVTVGTYYIVKDVTGDSTSIDISGLVNDSTVSGYMITTTKDGAVVKQTTVAKSEIGSITIAEEAAERIVVTYNETGAIESIATTAVGKGEEVDIAGTETSKVFLWNSLNGMVPVSAKTISGLLTVDTTDADKVEIAPIYTTAINAELTVPAAVYDVTITVNNGARTDVYVNDQMMFNNVNQGSDNYTVKRVLPATAEYTAKDVYINEGYATFKMYDDKSSGTTVTKVTFVKTPDNKTRAKRVYAIGDSLVAKYYGDAPEGQEGLVRTGWGDVLGNYMAEGVEVTNLGNSGAHAEGMLTDAFTNVMHSAKAGDVVIWESGYNDRTYSTVERMKAAITTAIDFCKANDIEIYLVTPNASSHDYKESVVWASSIIELGTETETPVIDLSADSYNFLNNKYSEVDDVHALLQAVYNNTGDTLHSTYNAANCWAAIVAQGLYKAGKTGLVNTEYTYTYNDGTNDITVGVNLMDTTPAASADEGTTDAE